MLVQPREAATLQLAEYLSSRRLQLTAGVKLPPVNFEVVVHLNRIQIKGGLHALHYTHTQHAPTQLHHYR